MDPDSDSTKYKQQNIFQAMCAANPQDSAAYGMLELVVLHNVSITKFRDPEFRKHLRLDVVAYQTFIDVMIELTGVVEEKIAAEMKDNRGCILHDGWSRYGRHYVALMAAYLIKEKAGDVEVEKQVISLLACSTLPHDDEESKFMFIENTLCFCSRVIISQCAPFHIFRSRRNCDQLLC